MQLSISKSALTLGGCLLLSSMSGAQSLTGPSVTARDPQAVQLLSSALQKAGGQSGWQSLHGARVQGTFTTVTHSSSGMGMVTDSIDWTDDWSTGRPRYVRKTTNGSATHTVRHTDSAVVTTMFKGRELSVRQFDVTTVLLTHLPAAALAIILKNDNYLIYLDPRATSQNDFAVDVSTVNRGSKQVWLISKTTGQIDAVQFSIPDAVRRSQEAWEMVIYKQYRLDGGISLPSDVTLIRPTGQFTEFHFSQMEPNPSVSANDFVSGSSQ